MRIGALLLPTDPLDEAQRRAQELEQAGFDHLWTYDHMTWRRYRERPWFSATVWLAAVAAATDRVEVGTMVANPNIHHPLNLAKDFVGIDHLSSGRALLGIGAGGIGFDATVMGREVMSPGQRIDRLIEHVGLLQLLMTGDEVDHEGTYYRLDKALVRPVPHRRPRVPILVAAGGSRGLTLAAEQGDGWITWGDSVGQDRSEAATDEAVSRQMAILRRSVDEVGRSWEALRRVFLVGNTEARPLTNVETFMRCARKYAELGFTDLVFHHPRPTDPVWNDDPAVIDDIARRMDDLHAL